MPRGIPNAKRDETGMRYTMFNVPLVSVTSPLTGARLKYLIQYRPNPKHMSTTYLKSETQTLWTRNASRKGKAIEENLLLDTRSVTQLY